METIRLRYSYYGWRARIGLLVPAANVVMEPEMTRMIPDGVSVHASRLALAGAYSDKSAGVMVASVAQAAALLRMTDPSVMVFGCTSSSFLEDEQEIRRRIEEVTGAPAITSSGAILQGLRCLGVQKLAVATPYPGFVNDEEKRWLESEGFRVMDIQGLDLGKDEYEVKLIGRQPPQVAYALALRAARCQPEAVFISCGNFSTAPIIEALERDLGVPVVTSTQATLWHALRTAGVREPIEGYGALMRK